ncbi:MAG: hypothetical protein M0D54_10450 [Hyphomonadaceae bacterium JAD_PAG50586_4]|nr:MAG: hypothetical protein M0D54_10450 [Hyphomonadaceae bacterium JAD_PAG50586_4]
MRSLFLGSFLALTAAGVANAEPLSRLKDLPCQSGRITNDDIILALAQQSGIVVDSSVLAPLNANRLGDHMVANLDQPAWRLFRGRVRDLISGGPSTPEEGLTASIANAPAEDRERLFVNRNNSWFVVQCESATNNTISARGGEGGPEPGAFARWVDGIIVAQSIKDADVGLSDREFAEVSYTDDRENDDEIISTNLFIGLPEVFGGRLRPYVEYERVTSDAKPINNLDFGLAAHWTSHRNANAYYLIAEYQSDDELDSEVNHVEFRWLPIWARRSCLRLSSPALSLRVTCPVEFTLDSTRVTDPGEKTALQTADSYDRYGFDVGLNLVRELDDGGSFSFKLSYNLREPFDTDGPGDVGLGRASLSYQPSEDSNFNIGLEYENGENVESLERMESLKLTFGFRR